MKLVAAVALVLVTGCPKKEPPPARGGGGGDAAAPAPVARDGFHPSATPMVIGALAPATLDWDRRVASRGMLENVLEDGAEAVAEARANYGRFIVSFEHGAFDPYDAASGTLRFRAHGLEGMDLDPPVSFDGDPDIMIGSLPGPAGGSVRMRISELIGTITIDAAGAAALVAAEEGDSMTTQFLMELGELGSFDNATYVNATLHGVRLVRLGSRELFVEGAPSPPLRQAP